MCNLCNIRTAAVAANPPNLSREDIKTGSATFQIIIAKLYVVYK